MITVRSSQNNRHTELKEINKNDSILIIAKASTETCLNKVIRPESVWEVKKMYGEYSDLTTAYLKALRLGARNVYLLNAFKTTDFIDCINTVRVYNFAFIVPVGVKLSDTFFSSKYKEDLYFAEYYLNELSENTNSTIVMTDEHASLYQHIDHFLKDMNNKVGTFKEKTDYLLEEVGNNLLFCMNILRNEPYANLILATSLANSKIGSYPNPVQYKAIFDFDGEDIEIPEMIYFRNNIHTNTSIENLKNFRKISDANKIVPIDRVIKEIEKNIDLSFILGRSFNYYTKMQVHDYLDNYLRSLVNDCISDYSIGEIQFIANQDYSGYIKIQLLITPINSLEDIEVIMEAK